MEEPEFSEAVHQLDAQFQRLIARLHEERRAILREKAALEEEKRVVTSHNGALADQVRLDVGGQVFHTTRAVLTKERGSMLECMFSGRFPLQLDADGCTFIDRDPAHFPLVLQYLRDGATAVPAGDRERAALLREARFYGLDGLSGHVSSQCLKAGLVAHWPLDEGEGSQVCDVSGNGTHGAITNPQWCRGPDGARPALHLGDRQSEIHFAYVADVFPTGNAPYSISVWVRKPGVHWCYVIFWGEEQPNQVTGMLLNPEDCKHVWWNDSTNLSARPLNTRWHHLVMQYDGQQQQIWRDGVCVARDTPDVPHSVQSAQNLMIGRLDSSASLMVADLRVYNRALPEDHIQALFHAYRVADEELN